ncbi:MAG: type I DNA topoisomerase [bacterium]|nr:MAG: type I DNA topoisomerase [bacterium]
MTKPLIIVESPTKARTIGRILGGDYQVLSSNGHVIDLPQKELAVDPENGFVLKNRVIPSKRKILSEISKAAKDSDRILMATDPDREGEAIAYLLASHLKIPEDRIFRVLFHEITRNGVLRALENPGKPDHLKFEAQQARRAIDRLVGYKLSPVLWERIKRGLSAGRVQSVALRLVSEREKAIQAFQPEDYWLIFSHLEGDSPPPLKARLVEAEGKKVDGKGHRLSVEAEAVRICDRLRGERHVVSDIQVKKARRSPSPPFITSTLQQEAARKLRFTAKRTMMIAQQLYEGVSLGDMGTTGLITYMRTDSVRVSAEAVDRARGEIRGRFGPDYLPEKARYYRNRKGTQDAHEAIRPARPELKPSAVDPFLDKDQKRLYELIYRRFLASQMADAQLERTRVKITAGPYLLEATGQVVLFKGFTALYEEGRDEDNNSEPVLPSLAKGQELDLKDVEIEKKTTQPPPRYTEATLVKELEEKGIGRPSTYAAILDTIQKRNYVTKEQRRFIPTALGMGVSDFLIERFPRLVDVQFTAKMEDELDDIEEGKRSYREMLTTFYDPFVSELEKEGEVGERHVWGQTDMDCPECGRNKLLIRTGKNGEFVGCSGYPECRFTSNFTRTPDGGIKLVEEEEREEKCPVCGNPMVVRQSRAGPFLGCSLYPECRGTRPLSTGVHCPEEGCDGELVIKRSKKGRTFYGCSNYPNCRYAVWDEPVDQPCAQCDSPIMTIKSTRGDEYLVCPRKGCGYRQRRHETD